MTDEMYFSNDERALLRGKRRLKRTETCRPCLVHVNGDNTPLEGVVMDVTPFGMMVRMIDTISLGARVSVQLMRDDNFAEPLGAPKHGEVVRHDANAPAGFTDHGVLIAQPDVPKTESRPANVRVPRPARPSEPPRMHSIDFTVGGERKGKGGG